MGATDSNVRFNITANDAAKQAFDQLYGSMEKVNGSFEKLKKLTETAFVGITIVGVVEGFIHLNEQMDQMGKAAQKIGIPVDQLSKLSYAASLADVSFDTLQSTIGKFDKGLSAAAATGKGDVADALKVMGISLRDANGNFKSQIQVLEDAADKFASYRESQNKTALAQGLFNKQGAEMLPLLNEGARGIEEAGKQLQLFGGVITPEAARTSNEFLDDLTKLKTAFTAIAEQVVLKVTPGFTHFLDQLVDFMGKGGGAKLIADDIIKAFDALGTVALDLYSVFGKFGALVVYIDDRMKGGDINAQYAEFEKNLAGIDAQVVSAKANFAAFYATIANGMGNANREGGIKQGWGLKPEDKQTKNAPAFGTGMYTQQIDQVQKLIDKLRAENAEYTKGNLQKQIDLALVQAGSKATEKQRATITDLIIQHAKLQAAQDSELQSAANEMERIGKVTDLVKNQMESWLDSIIDRTFNLRDALFSVAKVLAETSFSNLLTNAVNGGLSGHPLYGGGGLSGILGTVGSLLGFGGARAGGGSVSSGSAYLVGENGPELFEPSASGMITPNHELGSRGGGTVIFQVSAPGADRAAIADLKATLAKLIKDQARTIKNVVSAEKAASPGFAR